ncbi:MAG: hypothetical protein ABWK05_03815 [Pyrobaculum sp.]
MLFRIFDFCYLVDEVVDEVRSERAVEFLAEGLASGFFVFYPFRRELEPLVRQIVSLTDPRIRRLDPPEAYAVAIGLREGAVVLTENKGAINVKYIETFKNVKIWRSLELLRRAAELGFINLEEELERYEREAGHRFPRKRS